MQDFKKIEEEMLKFWKDNKIYEKAKKKNEKGKKFYFLQGPPYTSGRLHIGHAWNNNMKDIAMRFFRLNGYNVWDRAGYDMHGLPTENKVQQELKLEDKQAIVKYGLDKFAKRCYEFSYNNALLMNQDLQRLGIWMDFDKAYMPIKNEFMSSEWLLIRKAWEQKRLYKGKKVMQWCGTCETSLAKHELEYENVKENSIFLKFKLKGKKNEYIIVWTTTPWTIPFNLAVMVNPDLDYVKSEVETKSGKEVWYTAKALANVFISGLMGYKFKITDEFKGEKMKGLEYEHPFYNKLKKLYDDAKKKSKNVHTVILSSQYVDTSAGSGLVHCAPGCGPEDYEVGREYGIEALNTLDEKGIFQDSGEFTGMVAKRDDKKFIKILADVGSLVEETPVEHEYAHCWRCHNPVIFKTTEQWFMKTEDLVKKILDYNKKTKWVPKTVQNSYEAWITNLRDNGITRQRFWGTPAPIWECSCGHVTVIGSKEELEKLATTKLPKDLHKPWIDEVKIKCPKCKKEVSRITDVLDVWIDSGTVSWNCLEYPQREDYFKEFFPADLIIEASEQARLWFSMLQICSTIMFNKSCYNGVFGHGMILDFQGLKMSKSLGNIISPYEVIDKYSSEILRYYICETKAGENINFNWEDVKQKQRNLLVLLNTANYLIQMKTKEGKEKPELEEKYILSRLHSSIAETTELFESFNFDKTITAIEKLYLDVSRIYIKLTRDKSSESPALVYSTLKESYLETLKMFSTICPLATEYIWQQLRKAEIVKEESIHLVDWPKSDKKKIDKKLEEEFEVVLKIIESGFAERDKVQIGLKWPLAKAEITCENSLGNEMQEIIAKQLNVKKLEFKKSKEISVKYDTKMTPALESEGYARELSRKVQALRKTAGLVKADNIDLVIVTDDSLKKLLESQKEILKERTNSKSISIETKVSSKKFQAESKDKIKDKEVSIHFNKL
jgi:isoleucyl-tRNA synthetase